MSRSVVLMHTHQRPALCIFLPHYTSQISPHHPYFFLPVPAFFFSAYAASFLFWFTAQPVVVCILPPPRARTFNRASCKNRHTHPTPAGSILFCGILHFFSLQHPARWLYFCSPSPVKRNTPRPPLVPQTNAKHKYTTNLFPITTSCIRI